MKSLVGLGNTKIPDGLQRLDILTREESGMAVARNLEMTQEVDGNVKVVMGVTQDVDENVQAAMELIEVVDGDVQALDGDIQALDGNVKVIEQVTRSVDQNVKIIVDGTQSSFTFFMHLSINFYLVSNSNEPTKTYVAP